MIRRRRLFPRLVVLLVALPAVAGCGKESTLAPLHGTVTYRGRPLEFGSVTLQPAHGGQASRADIQPDGSFAMKTFHGSEGATIGLNRIRVACYPAQRPAAEDRGGSEGSLGKSLIPEHYNSFSSSDLSVEVLPIENPPLKIELND